MVNFSSSKTDGNAVYLTNLIKITRYAGTLNRMNSSTILDQVRSLDPHILAAVHDQYYPEVYRYARFRLADEQAAEDIAAEVFLRLLDSLHRQKGPQENLRAWLLGTAAHMIADTYRKQYRQPQDALEDIDLPQEGDSPDERLEEEYLCSQVRGAMQQLTADQQHVLALRFSEERSLEETARAMGKSIGAVKVLQFRALGSLRRLLEKGKKKA